MESKKAQEIGNLEKLKQEYLNLLKQYALPDFKFMNENFEIENIEIAETELFIKMIRKHITEKVFFVLRTMEMFLNPHNAPLFILNMLKHFSEIERQTIKELYERLSRYEIEAFGLETSYDEKKEVDYIRRLCNEWTLVSKDLEQVYHAMKYNYNKDNKKSSKSYFG